MFQTSGGDTKLTQMSCISWLLLWFDTFGCVWRAPRTPLDHRLWLRHHGRRRGATGVQQQPRADDCRANRVWHGAGHRQLDHSGDAGRV